MLHVLAANFWLHDLWHPLFGRGYQFWSGIAGSFILGGGLWAGVYALLRKHNCHVHRCWRMAWHEHPDTGHPVCKRHHPDDPRDL